jgi:hypothetical protein
VNVTREACYSALFSLLVKSAAFTTTSRRLRHWSDVSSSEKPALFMATGKQTPQQVNRLPTKWVLDATVYIYVNAFGSDDPGPILNSYLDAIEAALLPNSGVEVTQTLGGLVSHCWIDGTIETDEGTLGDVAVAIVPIKILAT